MTRRVYITGKKLWEARANNYAEHFAKREQAKAFHPIAAERTLRACAQMPEPRLDLRGALDTWTYSAARAMPIHEQIQLLRESGTPSELFVKWYWSDAEWDNFVRQFNALPEPEPLYEISMEAGYPEYKVVPYVAWTTGGQVRDNSGTTTSKRQLSTSKGRN